MERVVRRVELANETNLPGNPNITPNGLTGTGLLLTSAATGGLLPIETVKGPRANSMIEIIQQFGDLATTIERISTKTVIVQVDFPTTDFPKETSERLEIIARCDKYVHAMEVKDHMLWSTLKEKEKVEELLQEEKRLSAAFAKEVADWADMAQGLAQQNAIVKREKDILSRRNAELINILRANNIHYDYAS